MPRSYPPEIRHQVVELARAGTRVKQLAVTFGMSEATIYNWLKQEQIDRGETYGVNTDQAIELAAARRRIRQLETELAVSRKVNELFLDQDLAPKASTRRCPVNRERRRVSCLNGRDCSITCSRRVNARGTPTQCSTRSSAVGRPRWIIVSLDNVSASRPQEHSAQAARRRTRPRARRAHARCGIKALG